MNSLTLTSKIHFTSGTRTRKEIKSGPAPTPVPGRLPRVARLMALAIRFEKLISEGVVKDYAELAHLGHVTRARMTQIMNLQNLAPKIQEEILFLPRVEQGRDSITERDLRQIVAVSDWKIQQRMWDQLKGQEG